MWVRQAGFEVVFVGAKHSGHTTVEDRAAILWVRNQLRLVISTR